MNIVYRIFNGCKIRVLKLYRKLINTYMLTRLDKNTYLFLQMAVKWHGMNLIKYNFGDDLNVYLFEELTGKKILKYDEFFHYNCENFLGIGSIIEWCSTPHSVIWGSGAMYGNKTTKIKAASVLALRGKYSKDYLESCGIKCPNIFGDPALLLPMVYNPKNIRKKYKYGIVPHIMDYDLPIVVEYRKNHPEILFIDLHNYNDWHEVINLFLSCENIISSSLHGLIVSDAYGIPNVHVIFSNQILGGDFKYRDYYSGVGKSFITPLDFRESICIEKAQKVLENFKSIEFNYKKLLSVFPFNLSPQYSFLIDRVNESSKVVLNCRNKDR